MALPNVCRARARLCCTNRLRDSLHETSMVAGSHEQLVGLDWAVPPSENTERVPAFSRWAQLIESLYRPTAQGSKPKVKASGKPESMTAPNGVFGARYTLELTKKRWRFGLLRSPVATLGPQ